MNKELLKKITPTEAELLLDKIWEEVKPDSKSKEAADHFNEVFNDYRYFKVLICYFLWKMKTDKSIKTWEDLDREYHKESFAAPTFMANDLCLDYYPLYLDEWNKLLVIKDKYSEEELAACVLKTKHDEEDYYDEAPLSVGRLANALMNIKSNDKVLEINAGRCEYLLDSKEKYHKAAFIGASDDYTALFSGLMKAEVLGLSGISFVGTDYDENDINKVFINTDIERPKIEYSRYSPRDAGRLLTDYWQEYPVENNAWNLCAAGLYLTNFKGRVVAVMNAGELTLKFGEVNRKFLCDNGYIEGVIALPDKMYSTTWVNTYLVIFSRNNTQIRFLDARKKYEISRLGGKRINIFSDEIINEIVDFYNDDSKITIVQREQIVESGYNLNPLRYVLNNELDIDTVEFGSLIRSIKRGITLKAAEMDRLISDKESNVKCLKASHLSSGVIEEYSYYQEDIKKWSKNLASYGDILLSKVGSPFKVAMADADYLIIGNVYIISLDQMKVSPEYIRCFLLSKKGQEEIEKLSVGSNTPILNIADLEKIRIPVYKKKKQIELEQRACEAVKDLSKYHHLIREINDEVMDMFE